MSDLPADSAALPPSNESWLAEPKPADGSWSNRQFVFILLLALAVHALLIFLFGTKKQIVPVPLGDVPHLQLTDRGNELVALTDPTLFVRPNAHDVVTAFWRSQPTVGQPNFDWPELPHYLAPGGANFGSAFHEFVKNSLPTEFQLEFKPEPAAMVPEVTFDNPVRQDTTMKISQELARRPLLDAVTPPVWPRNDVIAPSTIQVLVDTDGKVYSAVVLPTSRDHESRDTEADQKALQLVRNLRFAPASQPTIGTITFLWSTIPTNAPPASVP